MTTIARMTICLLATLAATAASFAEPGTPALTGAIAAAETVPGPSSVAVVAKHGRDIVVTTSLSTHQLLTHRLEGDTLVPIDAKPTGTTPRAVALAQHGQYAVTVNSDSDAVSVHAVDANGFLTPICCDTPSGGDNPFDVAVAFEDLIVVANRDSDTVTLFGMNRRGNLTSRGTFPAGVDPHVIAIGPQGTVAVANSTSNDLTIFDLDRQGNMSLVEEAFAVGGSPRAVAFDRTGHAMYVAVRGAPGTEDRIRGYSVSRPTPSTIELTPQSDTPAGYFVTDMKVHKDKLFVPTVDASFANEVRSYAMLDNAQLALEDAVPLPGPTSFKKVAPAGPQARRFREPVYVGEFQANALVAVEYR